MALELPSGGFSSGPATRPAPTPVPPPTTTPPTPGQVDPREQLAALLAPVPGHPLLRRGKVMSLDTTTSVWAAYVSTDGFDDRPRRMQWNGSGAKPVVGEAVFYYSASPVPLIIGRVDTANEDQDFGSGTVSGGDFVDGAGSIRGAINTVNSTVTGNTSSITTLNSTVSSHTSTINSHTSSINSLNSTVSGHTSTLSTHTTQINSHGTIITSHGVIITSHGTIITDHGALITQLLNRMANVEARLTAGGH